jgi:hypothetical protein
VYWRTQSNPSDISLASSAVRSHAWSLLSLNDISVISVFRLPVTADEINAFGPGLTLASLLTEQAQADQEARQPASPPIADSPPPPVRSLNVQTRKRSAKTHKARLVIDFGGILDGEVARYHALAADSRYGPALGVIKYGSRVPSSPRLCGRGVSLRL